MLAIVNHRQVQTVDDAPGNVVQDFGIRKCRQNHHEFITAHPRHGIALTGFGAQNLGHFAQNMVARRMAQRVIDRLEIIKVDVHQAKWRRLARKAGKFGFQRAPVAQPGQNIGQRLFFGHHLGTLQPQVQIAQFIHHGRFCFDQIHQFDGQIGRRKIGVSQRVVAHGINDTDAE